MRMRAFFLIILLLALSACAARTVPEPPAPEAGGAYRQGLVVLGNLNRAVGGFAKLEYVFSFADAQGLAQFRSRHNDLAMTLLEALSVERFQGLGTTEGRAAFAARMEALAEAEAVRLQGHARLERYELR